jgi:tellurite methyltransferase
MLDAPDWGRFIELTRDQPPWPRLIRAAGLVGRPGDALDLGCGGGRDTGHLLRAGFHVTAVDASPWALPALRRLPHQRRLQFVQSAIEDFVPEKYDLVNAQFVLPFIPADRFRACVSGLIAALRPGAVFAATFFGINDQWNVPGTPLTFINRAELDGLLAGLSVMELTEEDADGKTAEGTPKHWHVYHVIATGP